jgi:hypothetical protein
MTIIFVLALLTWLILGILGVVVKSLIWLAIVAFVLFVVTGIILMVRIFRA